MQAGCFLTMYQKFCGIDFGSKLAGTTAICFTLNNKIFIKQSKVKQNADDFIRAFLNEHSVSHVFFDAPLTLPFAYFQKGENFFYREADVQLQAMSPMFLGGLTARAIQLKHQCSPTQFVEAYPAAIANQLHLKELGYKKQKENIEAMCKQLEDIYSLQLIDYPQNWHQFDALLAYIIGVRFFSNTAKSYGNIHEGLIWV